MTKYRKKPVIVDAMEFTYPVSPELRAFIGDSLGKITKKLNSKEKAEAEIKTLEDGKDERVIHIATEGDMIIKGVHQEFYACKPDIFEKTYEKVK